MKRAPRVGVFGLLGSGNLGNDGSLEAVLGYLRAEYPDAVLGALVGGPEIVRERYGLDATPLHWNQSEYETASGLRSIALKGFGKLVDIARTAAWVRKQDVVIVPGMGVLEATLPLRPWGFPYSLFLLSATGRLFGTKVALVCVGANHISARATRTLVRLAGRLAAYRSYRDAISRDAMRAMGVDTSRDEVYPDLAFALPTPDADPKPGTVGVGVMAYYGGNDDRADGDRIYRHYVDTMNRFVAWLVDQGREVRLFIGDRIDRQVVDEIIEKTASPLVTAASAETLDELMHEMAAVDSVVATRYHNVLCALKVAKPAVAIGYAPKNDVLMAEMGLDGFTQRAKDVTFDKLVEQFTELENRSAELRQTLLERNEMNAQRLKDQFAALSAALFGGGR
ncbi:polysaccharide pyruvyl transferase family protein [Amycolatopsis australiensis]|uniref:Polysaccharide pyruvyl transferase family protein WcaK n=1 Tax=Amycolatopsis australiensis TaxID=546364 RepID=A0A1K1PIG6_9PSEU|nr:polysaccharide pyruvyl transferase family protein [Amycolatopsis australiensis]SFW47227.1 Polysaccharide pyruvyl transferase family protein WcaK [Amycolatopsis australiensis]